ncbi:MAG: amidohydrolase [Candidatus Cloacimonetes bacterium]|nr:amidohydrolase [Candidatus Cloacimonadota bacterium]
MILLYNAVFHKMTSVDDICNAILIDGEKIVKLYSELPPDNLSATRIDLNKAHVYPGFIDTHTHSFEGGLYSLGADLAPAENLRDVLDILSQTQAVSGKIFGYHFDENNIPEKRFPTISELDMLFPDKPVLLRRVDGHSCVINSCAAKSIPWDQKLPSDFNGYLKRRANGRATNWFHRNLDDQAIIKAYGKAAQIALKTGHTAVHTMIGDAHADIKHFNLIKDNLNLFPVDFILYPQITDIDLVLKLGSPRIGGCILADGSFGSHTAALLEPYADDPDNYGILYHTDEFWESFITRAHNHNLQIAIHCIGDAAISQILRCYHQVQKDNPKDLRHEIIHNELTSDQMLDRMAEADISSVMQPLFDRLWGGDDNLYEKVLGKERTSRTNRLRSILNRGILTTGGSDWYVTEMNALKGIDAAVRIHNPAEAISPFEAVSLYTSQAARLSFDEDRTGMILPGYQADLTCLAEDILSSSQIHSIKIRKVIKRGEIFDLE